MNAAEQPTSATPILDRAKPFPPQDASTRSRRTLSFVLWMALGAAFGVIIGTPALSGGLSTRLLAQVAALFPDGVDGAGMVGIILSIALAFFVGIVIHEAAHAVVGALVGFRLISIRVSRFQLDLPFKFTIYRGTGTGAGGWVSLVPQKRDNLALRAVAMIAAGPLSNLLTAAILILLPFSKGFFVLFFIIASTALGAINLIPFRHRAQLSDGRRIVMLLSSRARGERWLAILRLIADLADGTPPESLSREYIALAIAVRDNTSDTVTAYALAYSSAFHRRDNEEAGRMLEVALQHAGYAAPILRQALMTDAAVFQGRRRRRADLAEAWLGDMPARTEIPWLRDLAEAGVLESRGDVPGALAMLGRADEKIRAESNPVRRDLSRRSLERWRNDLNEKPAVS
ncbi:MAG TPA: M50 family metallopeptidase [Vicinamibacterales bacterium]